MRGFWVKFHLLIAAFFAPMLFAMAMSGGLYLIGVKGTVDQTPVELIAPVSLDPGSATLEEDVRALLNANDIDHEFEYVKKSGSVLYTRPTSRDYYEINLASESPVLTHNRPDLQKRLVELHKGHGPVLFKDLQKVMATGLLLVLLSGVWLGLSSPRLRVTTAITTTAGLTVFLLVAFPLF